jgi:hypothetical protein
MSNEHNKVWVNYMCGKKVQVNYKGNVDNFIKQLDEYNEYVISIFIEGCEDKLWNIPRDIKDVFCLLTTPSYLRVGCIYKDEDDRDTTKIVRIEKIKHLNKDRDLILVLSHRFIRPIQPGHTWDYDSSQYKTIAINKVHSEFFNDDICFCTTDFEYTDWNINRAHNNLYIEHPNCQLYEDHF